MQRLFTFTITLAFVWLCSYAQTVKWVGCTPENDSEIKSFDFIFNFDITEAAATLGEGEWGIGYQATETKYTALYEGTPENGILLGKALTERLTGASSDFVVNGNTVRVNFSSDLVPQAGKTYTLVVTNNFGLFAKGKGTWKSSTGLKYETSPLILTFKGAMASEDDLILTDVSIKNNQQINVLDNLSFTFSNPVVLNDRAKVSIINDNITAFTLPLSKVEDNRVEAVIESPIELLKGYKYEVLLPESSVLLKSNQLIGNKEFNLNIEGTFIKEIPVKSFLPTDGSCGLYTQAVLQLELPEGVKMSGGPNQAYNLNLSIYKDVIESSNFVNSITGVQSSTDNEIKWNLNGVSFEPNSNYIFYIPKDYFYFFNSENKKLECYTNNEINISVSTPSVAESGIPQFEFQTPEVFAGSKNSYAYKENMKLSNISSIRLTLKDYNYTYEGKSYKLSRKISGQIPKCQIYEVTANGDVLLYDMYVDTQQRETSTEYYNSISASVGLQLLEGKKYKVVIPEGLFVPQNMPALKEYVQNPRFEFLFEGAGSTEITPTGCNIKPDVTMHEVYNVIWSFDKSISLAGENPKAQYNIKRAKGTEYSSTTDLLLNDVYGKFYLRAEMFMFTDGKPTTLNKDDVLTIIVPEGSICYATDPGLVNKEFSIVIYGKDDDPVVSVPEFVNVEISADELIAANTTAVKGEKVTIQITPDEYWEVTALTRDGNDVLPFLEDGAYETPALEADTHIKATIGYKGLVINDNPAEVVEITDSNAKVYSHGDAIIAEGLNAGDSVAIYTTGGIVIANETVKAGVNSMSFKVRNGEVYLVRVNDKAAKIRH